MITHRWLIFLYARPYYRLLGQYRTPSDGLASRGLRMRIASHRCIMHAMPTDAAMQHKVTNKVPRHRGLGFLRVFHHNFAQKKVPRT